MSDIPLSRLSASVLRDLVDNERGAEHIAKADNMIRQLYKICPEQSTASSSGSSVSG
ncbi:hypothetical protein K8O92_00675 [Nocardia asteroides]|nr:hypothetical protein K8O92_00675 [Nocardia asteroides]